MDRQAARDRGAPLSSEYAVAVDIGGTKTAVGLIDADGRLGTVRVRRTPATDGPDAVLRTVVEAVHEVRAAVTVVGVGVGTAGVVDPETGVITSSTASLSGWAGTEIRDRLSAELGLSVHVVNDVHAHALGERWRGAGQGSDSTLYAAVGTGIGGALLLPAGCWSGSRGAAGHIGHVTSPAATGARCPCGRVGHLEAVASGPAMTDAYRKRSHAAVADLAAVAERAQRGDGVATSVLQGGAAALGSALGGLVNAFDPDTVVVGGGVAAVGPLWWEPMVEALRCELLPVLAGVAIRESRLGADAALVGAASLVWSSR